VLTTLQDSGRVLSVGGSFKPESSANFLKERSNYHIASLLSYLVRSTMPLRRSLIWKHIFPSNQNIKSLYLPLTALVIEVQPCRRLDGNISIDYQTRELEIRYGVKKGKEVSSDACHLHHESFSRTLTLCKATWRPEEGIRSRIERNTMRYRASTLLCFGELPER
jgi:hypothetical protein